MNNQIVATEDRPFGLVFDATKPRSRARSIISGALNIFVEEVRRAEPADDRTFQSIILLAGRYGFLGMTQRQLARELFVTPMTIQRWGKGERLPLVVTRGTVFNRLIELATDILQPPRKEVREGEASVIPFPQRRESPQR